MCYWKNKLNKHLIQFIIFLFCENNVTFYQCCGYGCSYDPDSFYYDLRIHVKKIPDPDPYLDSFFYMIPTCRKKRSALKIKNPFYYRKRCYNIKQWIIFFDCKGSRKKISLFLNLNLVAIDTFFFFSLKIAENGFWQQQKISHNYLD